MIIPIISSFRAEKGSGVNVDSITQVIAADKIHYTQEEDEENN